MKRLFFQRVLALALFLCSLGIFNAPILYADEISADVEDLLIEVIVENEISEIIAETMLADHAYSLNGRKEICHYFENGSWKSTNLKMSERNCYQICDGDRQLCQWGGSKPTTNP